MNYLRKHLVWLLVVVILFSSIPVFRFSVSADEAVNNDYLELYDPYAQLRALVPADNTDNVMGTIDFEKSDFYVVGTFDEINNKMIDGVYGKTTSHLMLVNSEIADKRDYVSFRLINDTWFKSLCVSQTRSGVSKGNSYQLIFEAPHSGKYKLIPGVISDKINYSMLLKPRKALTTSDVPQNYTQTLSIIKQETTIFSKTLALSADDTERTRDNINDDIVVELKKGENLIFDFKAPEENAPCDLYVSFKLALTEFSNQNIWDGKTAEQFAGGEGTESNPYRIKTASQLRRMVADGGMNFDGTQAHYSLMNDIYINYVNSYEEWSDNAPENNWYSEELNTKKFAGILDGNGHTVYGMYSCCDDDEIAVGFIQKATSGMRIRNLHIRKSYVCGSVCGAFVGLTETTDANDTLTFLGCSADNTVKVEGNTVGGFIGSANSCFNVENCYFTGNLECDTTESGAVFGAYTGNYKHSISNFYSNTVPFSGNSSASEEGSYNKVYYTNAAVVDIDGITRIDDLSDISTLPSDIWYKLPSKSPLIKSRGNCICDISGNDDETNINAEDLSTLRKNLLSVSGYEDIISDVNRDDSNDIRDLVSLKKLATNPIGKTIRNSEIQNISYNSVGQTYEKFEIKFDLEIPYDNPYDPDEIEVNGIFKYPSGRLVMIPAFYIESVSRTNSNTLLNYYANNYVRNGVSYWCLRIAGDEVGDYEFTLQVTNGGTDYYYEETKQFKLEKSESKGFVQVSKDNLQYFENSEDESLFYGTGSNIAWVRAPFTTDPAHMSYEYFIGQAKKANATLTRVWLCHWAWLEWMPDSSDLSTSTYEGLGRYNQCISHCLDKIFTLCEDADIRMILTLDDNNEHIEGSDGYDTWKYNPYNIANGGPAADTTDYWKNTEVREYYKKRLRYIVARWGYSTSLFSLNLWNDMTTTNEDIVDYLDELCQYTKDISEDWRPLLFGSNFTNDANEVLDYSTQSSSTDKPRIVQECGYTSDTDWFKSSLRNTLWNELFFGTSATMVWSHDTVDETGSWDLFGSVANFTKDLDFNKRSYTKSYINNGSASSALSATYSDSGAGFKTVSARHLGDVAAWAQKATENQFTINETDADMMLAGISPKLYGNNADRKIYKNDPTFTINCTNGGEMVVHLTSVGSGTNTLTATNKDGSVLKSETISGKQYFTIPLDAGTNEITLSNTGHDWIEVSAYYFKFNMGDKPENSVSVRRLISQNQQLALVQNTRCGEIYSKVFGGVASVAENVQVPFYELENGEYELKLYDIVNGRYISSQKITVTDNQYIAEVSRLEDMMAIRLIQSTP